MNNCQDIFIKKQEEHNKFLQYHDYAKAFDFCIKELEAKYDSVGEEDYKRQKYLYNNEWATCAINDARLHVDYLMEIDKLNEAEIFLNNAKADFERIYKKLTPEVENLFEFYWYRIQDRKYIDEKYIKKISSEFEKKTYEILIFFVTVIAVVFGFVQGGSIHIIYFRIPMFMLLAATLVAVWILIKWMMDVKK